MIRYRRLYASCDVISCYAVVKGTEKCSFMLKMCQIPHPSTHQPSSCLTCNMHAVSLQYVRALRLFLVQERDFRITSTLELSSSSRDDSTKFTIWYTRDVHSSLQRLRIFITSMWQCCSHHGIARLL